MQKDDNSAVTTGTAVHSSNSNNNDDNTTTNITISDRTTTQESNLYGDSAQLIAAAASAYNVYGEGGRNQGSNEEDLMRQARLAVANGWLEPSLPALPQQVTQVDNSTHKNDNNVQQQQLQITGGRASSTLQDEQEQAAKEVKAAEDNHRLAAELLANARRAKDNVDEKMKVNAEASTDELLSVKCRWNENYQRLVEYKNKHGHCQLLRNPKRSNKRKHSTETSNKEEKDISNLGTWIGQVRQDYKRSPNDAKRLQPYQIAALERIGFNWNPRENYWNEMFQQLKVYLANNGGKMPPRFIHNEKFPLGQWCDTQLDNYRKIQQGKTRYISQEKIDMLNQIGFIWDKRGQLWKDNYAKLKLFKEQQGHCNVTSTNNGGDKSFGTWAAKQKKKYSNYKEGKNVKLEHTLTDEQANLLDAIDYGASVNKTSGRKSSRSSQAAKKSKDQKRTGEEALADTTVDSQVSITPV